MPTLPCIRCPHPTACGRYEVCLIVDMRLKLEPEQTLAEHAKDALIEARLAPAAIEVRLAAAKLLNSSAAAMAVINSLRERELQYNRVPGWLVAVCAFVLLVGAFTLAAKLWKLWS